MDYANTECTCRHFLGLFEKLTREDKCSFMGGAPGAGWGWWNWRVRAETMWFSPSVAEGIFHIAVRRALDYMESEPYETHIIAWATAGFDDTDTFFTFRVGFLY